MPRNNCRCCDLLSPEPTSAYPGTEEKVRVLEVRAKQGLCLWSDRDARLENDRWGMVPVGRVRRGKAGENEPSWRTVELREWVSDGGPQSQPQASSGLKHFQEIMERWTWLIPDLETADDWDDGPI